MQRRIDRFLASSQYRVITAVLFTALAICFVVIDPRWSIQNALIIFGVLVSIAAVVVPSGWARRIKK
jgi:hypothetical protein